jgi:heme oxygenase
VHTRRERSFRSARLACPHRCDALEQDLNAIAGRDWAIGLPLLDAATAYADRIAHIAGASPDRLVGHAYTRYLGDLNGGQILQTVLGRSLKLDQLALAVYEFPMIPDLEVFRRDYQAALSAYTSCAGTIGIIANEAKLAFEFNIRLALAVRCALTCRLPAYSASPSPG